MNDIKALVFTIRTQFMPRLRMGLPIRAVVDSWKIFKQQRKLPPKYQRWGL